VDNPVVNANATYVYPAKKPNDIIPVIKLTDKKNKEDIALSEDQSTFTIGEKEHVFAIVGLENLFAQNDRNKEFHIDWIGENERSFYRKRIEVSKDDTSHCITSTIAIPPEKRSPGDYSFNVYYFRELIAKKNFTLLPKPVITQKIIQKINPKLELCRYVKKETGEKVGVDTTFELQEKRSVRAVLDFNEIDVFNGQELKFAINWVDSIGNSIFQKKISIQHDDTVRSIVSSISISPEKRKAGNYGVNVYLFDRLIESAEFTLKVKPKVVYRPIRAYLKLGTKIDKETGEIVGEASSFEIKEKGKVQAVLNIKDWGSEKNMKQQLRLKWINPSGKSLFVKTFDNPTEKKELTFSSSISATPEKRKPGTYSLQVYFGSKLVAKKAFELK
jgi:hypothetical protein